MSNGDAALVDELLALIAAGDSFVVVEKLYLEPDAERAANVFVELARRLYAQKSLARSVAIRRAGIQFCLCHPGGDAILHRTLRQRAKAQAYNLAADTWPGWGDEGIVCTASDLDAGLDAARLNLRLVRELELGPLPHSNSHWLLGAQWLARADYHAAHAEFSQASELARAAQNADAAQMNAGYAALVGVLRGDPGAEGEFARIVEALENVADSEDAPFFAAQLVKARGVFRAST
jgi:hypothetical protein